MTRLGHATACMDLPCEWAQFLYTCAERGLEDSALILIAIWHRQGTPVTQQFNLNHGHPDGDLVDLYSSLFIGFLHVKGLILLDLMMQPLRNGRPAQR